MNQIMLGAIAMASFTAGLFFLRFYKTSNDRFFLFFSIAFCIEAVNRVFLAMADPSNENLPVFYLIRLLAFGLILYAIVDKNLPRPNRRPPNPQS